MIDKIKNKIDEMKKDTSSYLKYIESFCKSEKAKELFGGNDDYIVLKESESGNEKKEDEYF